MALNVVGQRLADAQKINTRSINHPKVVLSMFGGNVSYSWEEKQFGDLPVH